MVLLYHEQLAAQGMLTMKRSYNLFVPKLTILLAAGCTADKAGNATNNKDAAKCSC